MASDEQLTGSYLHFDCKRPERIEERKKLYWIENKMKKLLK